MDILAPANGFVGDTITVKLVIAGTDTPVPNVTVSVITPSGLKILLVTDETGQASFIPEEVGLYSYSIPNPLISNRVTYIFEKILEKPPQPEPEENVTPSGGQFTSPSVAQALLANAPLFIGLLALLLLLLAYLGRRKKNEKK